MNRIEIEHGDAEQRSLHQIFDTKRYDDCEIRRPNVLIIKNKEVLENIEEVLNRILTLSLAPSPTSGRGMSRSDKERVPEQSTTASQSNAITP